MKLLKYPDFEKLSLTDMAEYINKLCDEKGVRHYFKIEQGRVFDIVFDDEYPMTEITSSIELSGLCMDYHNEPTDLQGQIFAE